MKRPTIKRLLQADLGISVPSKYLHDIVAAMETVERKDILDGGPQHDRWVGLIQDIKNQIVAETSAVQLPHEKIIAKLDLIAQRLYNAGCTSDSDMVSLVAEDLAKQ